MNDINWQEVAEETAENLDLKVMLINHVLVVIEKEYEDGPPTIKFPVISWPTFGLIVEKAAEMGWGLCSNCFGISFQKEKVFTELHFYAEDGHIKGACVAFNEIFKMEAI